jgi:hypothetical protein
MEKRFASRLERGYTRGRKERVMKPTGSLPILPAVLAVFLTVAASAQENAWTTHGPTDIGWVSTT